MMGQKITIRDVAREAQVSIATVSKALNGVDVVRPETKKRIVEAAKNLHYVPNLRGKQLKAQRTKMLGFYTHTIVGPFFSVLVQAISQEAERFGYGVSIIISADKNVLRNHMFGHTVDGLIGFEDMIDVSDLAAIKREGLKAVFIDRLICDEGISSITFDSFQAGKQLTDYLLSLNHNKIAFFKGPQGVYDSEERFRGYLSSLKEHGIPLESNYIVDGDFNEQTSYKRVIDLLEKLSKKDYPTAIIGGNDLSALGIIQGILAKGYQVPADFSVVGFDNIDALRYFKPSLTTIDNPIEEQGKQAVKVLVDLINEQGSGASYQLPTRLIERKSTRMIE